MKFQPFKTYHLNLAGSLYTIDQPQIIGILNVTPDSFYEGSRVGRDTTLLNKAEEMIQQGAHWLDIGGYSTRPNAEEVSEQEELNRVVPAIETILRAFPDALISVDTFRPIVAKAAVGAGAKMVNDVSFGSEEMFQTVANLKVPYVLMHSRGTPQTMQSLARYNNVVPELMQELAFKKKQAHQMGISDVILDLGFGFAKTMEHNYKLLAQLEDFLPFEAPLLVGISRKSMIYRALNITPEEALNGSTALHAIALAKGAHFLRVHDVAPAAQCVALNALLLA